MEVETILVNRYEICQQLSKKAARQTFLAKDLRLFGSCYAKLLATLTK
jgi:hypothetical protein